MKRGHDNVTTIVYMDCGKKRERGGVQGEIMRMGDWKGIEREPKRKGLREER